MSDGVFNVLIGGAIGFAGVALSQLFAWVLLRKQQAHESGERAKERDYQARKDLYINLAGEYSRLLTELGDLPNKVFKPTLVTETTTPFTMALSKAHLMANGVTAQALDNWLVEVQNVIQRTALKLTDIWSIQFDLDNTIKLYDKYSNQNDLILQDMGLVNLNPNENMEMQIKYLKDKFDNNRKLMEPLSEKRGYLLDLRGQRNFDYTRTIYHDIVELDKASLVAFKAIREELGLTWPEEYVNNRIGILKGLKKSLDTFLHEMEKKIETENSSDR